MTIFILINWHEQEVIGVYNNRFDAESQKEYANPKVKIVEEYVEIE